MDRPRHLAEDTNGIIIAAGISGFDDAVAVTIIVTLEYSFMANRSPITTRLNNRNVDFSLLLEIDTARVAAIIDIVGKV